jgi:sulfatase modifying factor 1
VAERIQEKNGMSAGHDIPPSRSIPVMRKWGPSVAAGLIAAFAVCISPAPADTASRPPASATGSFAPTMANPAKPPGSAPAGMVWIPGGEFSMGSTDSTTNICGGGEPMVDARPIHRVDVDGFWMDRTDVTNEQFSKFVAATGYVTIAERKPRATDFPGAPASDLVPGSLVFQSPRRTVPLNDPSQWWKYVGGANWKHPRGPASDLKGHERDPVVQVAYEDAAAYAAWAGKRLPTEAEWEFAARGGLSGKLYAWGDVFRPGHQFMANTYQGHFPDHDTAEDGFAGISPVKSFPANDYGLYDMSGNVWQWCSDWYRADYFAQLAQEGVARNPHGPATPLDPADPDAKERVQKGGSFLCTDQYCSRYMVGTRGKGEISTGTDHLGFRCVRAAVEPHR